MKYLVVLGLVIALAAAFSNSDTPSFSNGRILNGQDAEPHIAPFMIVLVRIRYGRDKIQNCGSVLLNSRWVLTAGHCLTTPELTVVVAGQHNVRVFEPWEQRRSVEQFYIHEDYCESTLSNDIALIFVNQPFVFNQYVQPIKLPRFQQIPTGFVRLFGWGLTRNMFADVLQVADIPIIDLALCDQLWGRRGFIIDETNVCAGPLDGSIAMCSGDSGGPLVQFDNRNEPIVVGIVSWGAIKPCGWPNSPGVYGRVSAFIDWIYRTIHRNYN